METIQVELTMVVDEYDLAEVLAEHGLTGEPVTTDDGYTLEVGYAESRHLEADVERALENWIARRGLFLVPTPVGDRTYVLRPPGD